MREGWLKKLLSRLVLAGTGSADLGDPVVIRLERKRLLTRWGAFLGHNGIRGDILEFGVFRGGTLIPLCMLAKHLIEEHQAPTRVFGFDSFRGLPTPTGKDLDYQDDSNKKKFTEGNYSADRSIVETRLRQKNIDGDLVRLVEGWYDDTLTPELRTELGIDKAILIHIDCDLYDSTIVALRWCADLIQQGTIILFDDWYCYRASPFHGEKAAFGDFLKENPHLSAEPFGSYSWHAQAFIISTEHQDPG